MYKAGETSVEALDADRLGGPSARLWARLGSHRTVALLPKRCYMVRCVDAPRLPAAEVAGALRLEMEAGLPADFGDFSVSWRVVGSDRADRVRYEVYVARSDALEAWAAKLSGAGCPADVVLPAAVAWAGCFDLCDDVSMFVAPLGEPGQMESAARKDDGTVSVRTLRADADHPEALVRGLTEEVRRLRSAPGGDGPLRIAWLGDSQPPECGDGIEFVDVGRQAGAADAAVIPALAGRALLRAGDDELLRTADLTPRPAAGDVAARGLYRKAGLVSIALLAACALFYTGLQVLAYRSRAMASYYGAAIAGIESEGEAIGRKIEQLRALTDVRRTRGSFQGVLKGLYAATPDGVTYSQVDLTGEGELRLRGTAVSLAQAFVLPERLEEQAPFEQVLLRDAAQSQRGDGTVTEFRVDCLLAGVDW